MFCGCEQTRIDSVPGREEPLSLCAGSERHRQLGYRGLAIPPLVYVCLRTVPSKVADDSVGAGEAQGFSLVRLSLFHQFITLFLKAVYQEMTMWRVAATIT